MLYRDESFRFVGFRKTKFTATWLLGLKWKGLEIRVLLSEVESPRVQSFVASLKTLPSKEEPQAQYGTQHM